MTDITISDDAFRPLVLAYKSRDNGIHGKTDAIEDFLHGGCASYFTLGLMRSRLRPSSFIGQARAWRTLFEGLSYALFFIAYVGSTIYMLLAAALLSTGVQALAALGMFLLFALPLIQLLCVAFGLIGSALGVLSLRLGPVILVLITYAILNGHLHYLTEPFSFVGVVTRSATAKEDYSNLFYINILVVLFCVLWLSTSHRAGLPYPVGTNDEA